MGRFSHLLLVAGISLVGGVALAQQGLIVEPWRPAKAVAPAPAAVVVRPMPSSGLAAGLASAPSPSKAEAAAESGGRHKWSPPVVELLVDPWAKARVTAPVTAPRWEPRAIEIIDPWAGSAPVSPRVASRAKASAPRSTIF